MAKFGVESLETVAEPTPSRSLDVDPPGETEAPRTRQDKWRAWVGRQMVEQVVENEQAKSVLADLEAKASTARKAARDQEFIVEAGEKKLNALAMDMVLIEQGKFVPPMFDENGNALALPGESGEDSTGPKAPDPALTAPLSALLISDSSLEKLQGSQLAGEYKLDTIADLERAMSDPYWDRKIKGFGTKRIDDLTDALTRWRLNNPVPGEADGRVKRCTKPLCRNHESGGLFGPFGDGERCPVCHENYFELVDSDSLTYWSW